MLDFWDPMQIVEYFNIFYGVRKKNQPHGMCAFLWAIFCVGFFVSFQKCCTFRNRCR